jgi:hypothetical protein
MQPNLPFEQITLSPVKNPLPPQPTLKLEIRGCGHIVSFKNTKMILPAQIEKGTGRVLRRAMLITDPKKQILMRQYEACIESALYSAFQTAGGETGTGQSLLSWIASCVFVDDSLDQIPESDGYRVERVEKGDEGAVIEITRIA